MCTWSQRLVYWYLKRNSKVFYVVTYSGITGCWFTSLVWLFSTSWVEVKLSSSLAQLLYNDFPLTITCCLLVPPCCTYLIVSINESHKHSSYRRCQSSTPLVLTGSPFLNPCCFDYWLWVVTLTITLTGTLLGGLGVVITLELIGLVLNMFYTSIFLGHFPNLCYALK
jgi:hypothetical protein